MTFGNAKVIKLQSYQWFSIYWNCLDIYIGDITRWREDTYFMFEWQEQYLTSVLATRTQNSYLGANVSCSFYYINILMTAFLMIFRRFPTTFRRLPKTFEEDPKMFRWYTNEFKYSLRDKLDLSEINDIFTSEDIITSRVKTSYRFYQFVTTRYTTDFYIINMIIICFSHTVPQYLGLRRVQLEAGPALRPGLKWITPEIGSQEKVSAAPSIAANSSQRAVITLEKCKHCC